MATNAATLATIAGSPNRRGRMELLYTPPLWKTQYIVIPFLPSQTLSLASTGIKHSSAIYLK